MIVVNFTDAQLRFPDATRISTDEHNNLEIWSGPDGDQLTYLVAHDVWRDVSIGDESE